MSVKVTILEKEIEQMNPETLVNIFDNQVEEFKKKDYLLERYSRSQEIRKVINESDDTKIELMVALESMLIDTATGYGMGKPVTYYDTQDNNINIEKRKNIIYGIENTFIKKINEKERNDYIDLLIKIFKNNSESSHNIELFKRLLIVGSADEMVYTDEDGAIQFAMITDDCLAFYNNDIKPKLIGFARRYKVESYLNKESKIVYEFYSKQKNFTFDTDNQNEQPLEYGGDRVLDVPFIRYDIGMSYIEQLISQIRCYELVGNNSKKIHNYNDNAILQISGYRVAEEDNVDEIVKEFLTSGVIFTDFEDSEAKWLQKNVDDNAVQHHKENLINDLFTIAGTFNPSNDNQVYQNTLSLMFKMYGLENKMVGFIGEFKKGLLNRVKKITKIINDKENKAYNYANIDISFVRNLPTNVNEELNFANQTRELLPLREIYNNLSFVENPDKMLKQWEEWQIKLAEIEAKKSEIMSEATQDDMMPDVDLEEEKDTDKEEDEEEIE